MLYMYTQRIHAYCMLHTAYCILHDPAAHHYRFPHHSPYLETHLQTNSPTIFGLHPNAEISYYNNSTKLMWRDLIELQPRTGGAQGRGGLSRDEQITSVAIDLSSKVPEQRDLTVVRRGLQGVPTPEEVVLLQGRVVRA